MSLVAKNLSFYLGSRPILSQIDLEVKSGRILGLIGPNGAGKSTLLKLLGGIYRPSQGQVYLDARPLKSYRQLDKAKHLAFVQQRQSLPQGFLVADIISLGRTPREGLFPSFLKSIQDQELHPTLKTIMQRTDTLHLANRHVECLSGGEMQRVIMAKALAQEPSYLLLDEPTNHLDLKYQLNILNLAKQEAERGVGVVIVMHDLNLAARFCDEVLLLGEGQNLAQGRPAEVLEANLLARVYQTAIEVFNAPDTRPVVLPNVPIVIHN
ncbi:MAG: ABC transporter ATP-binding protein [Deinococcales bacterium]